MVLDEQLRVEYANPAYYRFFQGRPEETVGRPLRELSSGRWDHAELSALLDGLGPRQESFFDVEVEQEFEGIGERVLLVDGRRFAEGRILLSIRDITDRKRFEERLADINERLEERVQERTEELADQAKRLRSLASRIGEAEQHERRRIAEFVHGQLQQRLAAAKMQLAGLDEAVQDEERRGDLARGVELLDEAIQEARRVSVDLSPPGLFTEGLVFALEGLARRFRERHDLRVTVEVETDSEVEDEDVRAFLHDAARELLFNVVKHAETGRARLRYRHRDDSIEVEVEDDGVGFDLETMEAGMAEGFGLTHIRERLRGYGGSLEVRGEPGDGCSVTMVVPLNPSRQP